jgi:dTMP kinase
MTAGKLITFEGGEGAGKSTQARYLAERLRASGHAVVVTREPGGTPLGESIRELILSSRPAGMTEFLLFAAARAEHVAQRIAPALAAGQWVICDRFIDSTRVYQGRLAGIDPAFVSAVESATLAGVRPALTVLLDLPAEIGLERALKRGGANRFDCADLSFHQELREGFLDIARVEPERFASLDAARSEADVADAVWAEVVRRLSPGG